MQQYDCSYVCGAPNLYASMHYDYAVYCANILRGLNFTIIIAILRNCFSNIIYSKRRCIDVPYSAKLNASKNSLYQYIYGLYIIMLYFTQEELTYRRKYLQLPWTESACFVKLYLYFSIHFFLPKCTSLCWYDLHWTVFLCSDLYCEHVFIHRSQLYCVQTIEQMHG